MYEGGIKPSCFQVFMNNNDFSCYVESRVFNDRRTYMSQDFFPCQLASSEVANFFLSRNSIAKVSWCTCWIGLRLANYRCDFWVWEMRLLETKKTLESSDNETFVERFLICLSINVWLVSLDIHLEWWIFQKCFSQWLCCEIYFRDKLCFSLE